MDTNVKVDNPWWQIYLPHNGVILIWYIISIFAYWVNGELKW